MVVDLALLVVVELLVVERGDQRCERAGRRMDVSVGLRGVGVAVTSGGPKNALEHVHFQRLTDQKILAVVVTRGGLVRDRVLRVGRALRRRTSKWHPATSTKISAAGRWMRCARSWSGASSRSAANTTSSWLRISSLQKRRTGQRSGRRDGFRRGHGESHFAR